MYPCYILFYLLSALNLVEFGSVSASTKQSIEAEIVKLVNQERARRNLRPLSFSKELRELARSHSANMAQYGFFSHKDHRGRTVGGRKQAKFPNLFGGLGENIAMISTGNAGQLADRFVRRWMTSSGHRRNILDASYDHIGVGVVQKNDRYYATQVFGKLIAILETELPGKLPYQSRRTLRFRFLGDFPKRQTSVFIHFPDKQAKFFLDDGYYYTGSGLYKAVWDGDYFSIDVDFKYGRGVYKLTLGINGRYYEEGLEILVE